MSSIIIQKILSKLAREFFKLSFYLRTLEDKGQDIDEAIAALQLHNNPKPLKKVIRIMENGLDKLKAMLSAFEDQSPQNQ